MGSPTSRRAFLLGRRTPPSTWGNFCARLSRSCAGQVRWEETRGRQQAWLIPAREKDVLHAHALCLEYRVQLALNGFDSGPLATHTQSPRLWVESQAPWAQAASSDAAGLIWRAEAGCKLKVLQDVGVRVLRDADPEQTVAQWLASEHSAQWPTGQGACSGIAQVQVMLADGTIAVLGPFGASATTPLRSLTVQKMIPKLFELASSEVALECARAAVWPLRFRLDALMPAQGGDVNLAWLFAGHGARLGWVQAVWFERDEIVQTNSLQTPGAHVVVAAQQGEALAQQLKESFDPLGIFP